LHSLELPAKIAFQKSDIRCQLTQWLAIEISIYSRKTKRINCIDDRIVTSGEVPHSMINDYSSTFKVEAALHDATVVGKPFSDPINAAIAAYPAHGFDADEWTKHHQGGPTGFLPRDWPANQGTTRLIAENQPIAWNPTGKGWKAEDTILCNKFRRKLALQRP